MYLIQSILRDNNTRPHQMEYNDRRTCLYTAELQLIEIVYFNLLLT